MIHKTCNHCGAPIIAHRKTRKYCSALCRHKAYLLRHDFYSKVKTDKNAENPKEIFTKAGYLLVNAIVKRLFN